MGQRRGTEFRLPSPRQPLSTRHPILCRKRALYVVLPLPALLLVRSLPSLPPLATRSCARVRCVRHDNTFFNDDLPRQDAVICLSGKDDIVNSPDVYAYLRHHGFKDVPVSLAARDAAPTSDRTSRVMYLGHLRHAQFIFSRGATRTILHALEYHASNPSPQ